MLLTQPRKGQSEARELCKRFPGFLLFCEQRVGKTWIACAAADYRKPRKLLIVTRKGGRREWETQLEEHLRIDWECNLRIETHEFFSRSKGPKEIRKWFKECSPDECMIILDESHKIKKRGSAMSMRLRQIAKRYAKYRIAMTGTPIGQGLVDGWTQMDFVDPSVFGKYEDFEERYCILGGFRGVKIIGYRNEPSFRRLLASRSYRVLLREVQPIPTKIRNSRVYFTVPENARKLYKDLESGITVEFHRRKVRLKKLMNAATKCQQVAGGFLIRDRDSQGEKLRIRHIIRIHDSKLRVLERILRQHPGEKIVIAARYKHELRAIRKVCDSLGVSTKTVRGGHPYDGVFDVDAIIIQNQAGIVIDLSPASIAIFYSMDYSFIVNAQMRSRILAYIKAFARYYYLLGRDTVDEDIYTAWRQNRRVADVILDRWRRREL